MPPETLGRRLRQLRDRLGYTQMDVVRNGAGRFAQTTYSQIERDLVKPRYDTLIALSYGFKLSKSDFFSALGIADDELDRDEQPRTPDEEANIEKIVALLRRRPDLIPGIAEMAETRPSFLLRVLQAMAEEDEPKK